MCTRLIMELKANELKEGDKGIIMHWMNQPDYVGNIEDYIT